MRPFLLLFTLLLAGCSENISASDDHPPVAPRTETVAVFLPVPVNHHTAAHANEFRAALRSIRQAVPTAIIVGLFIEVGTSGPADWLVLFDVAQEEGFLVTLAFAEGDGDGGLQGFRPVKTDTGWALGPLREILTCGACVTHPALHIVGYLDEPWHPTKRPVYPTSDLQDLYATLKAIPDPGTAPQLMLMMSRQIWRQMNSDAAQWQPGMADVVQISALEFQNHTYLEDLLDQNHTWSRRIIAERTPGIPLWVTVQTFGGQLGPGPGYWFPRSADLRRLLEDVTAPRYQEIYPITGIALQRWDARIADGRTGSLTLGDLALPGQPPEQVEAAREAVNTFNAWYAGQPRP